MQIHGLQAPLITIKALTEPADTPLKPKRGEIVIRRSDEHYPVYAVVFWVAAALTPHARALEVNFKGDVYPNVRVMPVRIGMAGVVPDSTDPEHAIDYKEFMHNQVSKGMVRVDHLRNAKGEMLGLPDKETYQDPDKFHEWTWGIFDKNRLAQLHRELGECEPGRGLAVPKYNIPLRVKRSLTASRGKTEDDRKADARTLKKIRNRLKDAEKIVKEVRNGELEKLNAV